MALADDIQKLYVAYFNRPADAAGFAYWLDQAGRNGGSTAAIANAFSASAEYMSRYAGLSNSAIVDAVYQNLFNRAAEPDGKAYWSSGLDNGTFNIGNIVLAIMNGAQNADAIAVAAKTAAANSFTLDVNTSIEMDAYAGDRASLIAQTWLHDVSDPATLDAALASLTQVIDLIVGVPAVPAPPPPAPPAPPPPSAPSTPDLAAADDSGSSSTDNITSVTTGIYTGTAEAGATVTLYDTDGMTVLGTATATGVDWAITSSALSEGAHTLTAKATTAAGTSTASMGLDVTVDTTAPTTTIATTALSADTGASGTDFNTKTAAQTISGTTSANIVSGEIVEVSIDNGSTWTPATTSVGTNTWSLAGVTLTASDTLKVRVTDTAGNSGTVASQAYVLDTTPPTTTIATAAFSADTGTSGTDFNTKTAAQTISGTTSANVVSGEIVEVSTDNGSSWTTATTSAGANTWSLAGVTLTASDTLKVHVTDAAGNSGMVASQAYVLDTTAPTTTIATMTFSADTGTSGTDFNTKTAAQTISGTASANIGAGEIVDVSTDDGSTWTTAATSVGANTWSLAGVTLTASDTLKVRVTDTAGNSGTVASQAYVLDTTAPTLASSSPADGAATFAVGSNLTLTFNETVALGTGNIVLKASSGDSVVESFNVATGVGSAGGTVTVSGATVTINPFADLSASTDYNVRIDATAVVDTASNAYAGIADATTLNFTTAAPAFDGTLRTTSASDVAAANAYLAGGAVTVTLDMTDPLFRNHGNISLSSFGTDDFLNIKLQSSLFPGIAGWQKQGATAHVIGTKSNAYSVERYRSVPNGSTSLTLTRTVRLTAPVADFPAFTPRQISLRSWQTANYHWSARFFISGLHVSSVGHIAFI